MRGIDIATYYANEAKRIYRWAKPELLLAQKLLDWLKGWPDKTISARDIYQYGPSAIRDRSTTLTVAWYPGRSRVAQTTANQTE